MFKTAQKMIRNASRRVPRSVWHAKTLHLPNFRFMIFVRIWKNNKNFTKGPPLGAPNKCQCKLRHRNPQSMQMLIKKKTILNRPNIDGKSTKNLPEINQKSNTHRPKIDQNHRWNEKCRALRLGSRLGGVLEAS